MCSRKDAEGTTGTKSSGRGVAEPVSSITTHSSLSHVQVSPILPTATSVLSANPESQKAHIWALFLATVPGQVLDESDKGTVATKTPLITILCALGIGTLGHGPGGDLTQPRTRAF